MTSTDEIPIWQKKKAEKLSKQAARMLNKMHKMEKKFEKKAKKNKEFDAEDKMDVLRTEYATILSMVDQLNSGQELEKKLVLAELRTIREEFHPKKSKEERMKERLERKQKREERKRVKKEFEENMEKAKIENLPEEKTDGDWWNGEIFVDGWNIIGCDKEWRKALRSRRDRSQLKGLIEFLNIFIGSEYGKNFKKCTLWFDGSGQDGQNGAIFVRWSGKGIIVDDFIVNMFTQMKSENPNVKLPLVITADRELMVRILKCGGKVMKSGRFYKMHKHLIPGRKSDDENPTPMEDIDQTSPMEES